MRRGRRKEKEGGERGRSKKWGVVKKEQEKGRRGREQERGVVRNGEREGWERKDFVGNNKCGWRRIGGKRDDAGRRHRDEGCGKGGM